MTILSDGGRTFTVLFTGRRGLPGARGDTGDTGPQGPGFRARGAWSSGTSYGPGDAVTDDSTAAQGVQSLFIQRDTVPIGVSLDAPRVDTARWIEVGATDLSNVTGAIWRVVQASHGFTAVGQPVGYSFASNRWVLTSNKLSDETPVAVVREVLSDNEFLLQTVGEITSLDPAVILPGGETSFIPGRFYYASATRGFLTLDPTVDSTNFATQAILVATGPTSGVVLHWQQTANVVGRRPVGMTSFYYTATAGQTVFTGADLDTNVLTYPVSDQTRVLIDGVDLQARTGFTAATGTSVTLATPLAGGETVEIRVPSEPLAVVAPGTSTLIDDISPLFDGVETRFPMTVLGGAPVAFTLAQNILLFLDGNTQEAFADYETVVGLVTDTDIIFTSPPAPGTRFWGLVGIAVSNLSILEVDTLVAGTGTVASLTFTTATGGALTLTTLTADDVVADDVDTDTLTFITGTGDTLTIDTLTSLLAIIAFEIDATGLIESGVALRAPELRGPTGGGGITAYDLTIDEGTF